MTLGTLSPPISTRLKPPHFRYLDGLRGLSALFVVLHHVWQAASSVPDNHVPFWYHGFDFLYLGQFAVDVFIVLSGFSLMLPIVQSPDRDLTNINNLVAYFRRRARRILPPYYASLLIAVALIFLVPILQEDHRPIFADYNPSFMVGAVISHIFLIHNLNVNWVYRINAPVWTVATEWQIYFLFPGILLPLLRRFGIVAPVLAGLTLALASFSLKFEYAHFWYIGLFALGMGGAIATTKVDTRTAGISMFSWPTLKLQVSAAAIGLVACLITHRKGIVAEMIFGYLTAWLLAYCAGRSRQTEPPFIVRLLSSKLAVFLGAFSYSLYLTHFVPLLIIQWYLRHWLAVTRASDFFLLLGIGVPCVILLAYLFHLAFEKPFMTSPQLRKLALEPSGKADTEG